METKSIQITPPEGYEVDKEKSTFEKIVFKPKQISYEDVARSLFKGNSMFWIGLGGDIHEAKDSDILNMEGSYNDPNNATSKEQLKCILAKNKLANVAKYLNGNWKPNLDKDFGYVICNHVLLSSQNVGLKIEPMGVMCPYSSGRIVFKSAELAKQAIQILGEETVKLALKPLY